MMKKLFLWIVFLAALLSAFPQTACSQRFEKIILRSLFADKQAYGEGDVVTILLMEFLEGSNETQTNVNSDNWGQITANTNGTLSSLIPSLGINTQFTNRNDNEGATSSKGTLRGKMTAIITEVLDNGLLSIEGTREISVNGEQQLTTLTGYVRAEDIRADNTLYSYQIANAQISYRGKGVVTDGGKPGIFIRIWNWIF